MTCKTARFGAVGRAALVGILTLGSGALTLRARAEDGAQLWQSAESIRAAAGEAARSRLGGSADASVEAAAIDERLKLPACSEPLEAEPRGAPRGGQGIVAVSCAGERPWHLFVPVRIVEQVAVLVARRNLQAGDVLAATDFVALTRASSALPYDYLTDPEQALGLALRRAVPAGTVLVPAALEHPEVIERGALVTLTSGRGTVRVKAEGVALEPGRLRERIRVRTPSGRIVEGVVAAPGEVRLGS